MEAIIIHFYIRHAEGFRLLLCGFGDFSSLGQKLPFWDESCRFEEKSPFKGDIFGDFSSLGQKLQFWDESCHFQDINCRFGDKCRFRADFFVRAIFGNFFKL